MNQLGELATELFKKVNLLAAIPIGILCVFGPELFAFFFGNEWKMSGIIVSYLAIASFFQLINLPLLSLRKVLNKEVSVLFINIILFVINATLIVIPYLTPSFIHLIIYIGVVMGICHFAFTIHTLHLVEAKIFQLLVSSVFVLLGSVGFFYVLRQLFF
jgi:O-antigen/teichoic acid export membrane protein